VVVGAVAWFAIATLIDILARLLWPAYADAVAAFRRAMEAPGAATGGAMIFTLEMMLARLAEGAIASIGAGFTLACIARGNRSAAIVLGALIIALFVPIHYAVWNRFPVWYHLVFLLSLLPLTVIGAALAQRPKSPVSLR